MNRFHTQREAKEFLVAEIAHEAARQGKPLTDIERKMLYFTETGWTLPDMADVADAFDQQYDQGKYEQRIAGLARAARKEQGKDGATAWADAVKRLAEGDHYLLVMIGQAGGRGSNPATWRVTTLLLAFPAAVLVIAIVLLKYVRHSERPDDFLFFVWVTALALGGVYTVVRIAVGSRRFDEWMDRATEWAFRERRR